MSIPIKIVLVQDKASARASLSSFISSQADLRLVGEASSSLEALPMVRHAKPELVIMDLRSMANSEINAPNAVREASARSKILILTEDDESEVFAALASEADGYTLKAIEFDRLHAAIKSVAGGEFWLDSAIAKKVVKALLDTIAILSTEPGERAADDDGLSPRELEVLGHVSRGLSNHQIADKLGISAETVKSHIRNIMKKLVVNDRTQAAVKGLKLGLI